MQNRSIVVAVALSMISSSALAQSKPTPSAAAPASSSTMPNSDAKGVAGAGMSMANSATLAVRFVSVNPADFMSSKLVGATVYNNQNESLGEIEDLVIKNGNTVTGVVVSVGGFLGLGESYVALDPSTLVLNQKDGKWRAYVNTSKDTLKNAPKFLYTKKAS